MLTAKKPSDTKAPAASKQVRNYQKPTTSILHKLSGQTRINQFLACHENKIGIEFIDQLFSYFKFTISVSSEDLERIPKTGSIIIIANHPTGSLDGLALLKAISQIRSDIKIIADKALLNFSALDSLLIPSSLKKAKRIATIVNVLENQEAVIWFPAGDISRAGPGGIKDRRWSAEFMTIARENKAPIIPILVEARNSFLFYCASFLGKPLGNMLLTRELLKQSTSDMCFTVGNPIHTNKLTNQRLRDRHLVKRFKKHLYNLAKDKNKLFVIEKPVAKPEKTKKIIKDLKHAIILGETRDNHSIYLASHNKGSALIKEIGRLREYTFRKVGEGTGSSRDLDKYDKDYLHLTLWQKQKKEIIGAYRFGECSKLIAKKGITGLYTSSLYEFSDEIIPYLQQSLELGRSFVHPDYWGKASLDYLWQGIGAFLKYNTDIRYLIGPVSMSADYPKCLINELVYYFEYYYKSGTQLAIAYNTYHLPLQEKYRLGKVYNGLNKKQGMEQLQKSFAEKNCKIPILFKQYTSIYEDGGINLLAFSVDPDFGDCIDGLLLADLSKLKEKQRKRYIG